MSATAKEVHAEDAFDAPSARQKTERNPGPFQPPGAKGMTDEIARREKEREAQMNGLSQEARARVIKIDALNKRNREELRRPDLILSYEATDEALERVERTFLQHDVSFRVMGDPDVPTEDRNRVIEEKASEEAVRRSTLRRLKEWFESQHEAVNQAERAKAKAEQELKRVAAIHQRIESLKAKRHEALEDLRLARQVHEINVAALAARDEDEALVARFLRISKPPHNTGDPDRQSSAIDGGRQEIAAAVAAWERVEPVLQHRIEVIEQELAKLEREYS